MFILFLKATLTPPPPHPRQLLDCFGFLAYSLSVCQSKLHTNDKTVANPISSKSIWETATVLCHKIYATNIIT